MSPSSSAMLPGSRARGSRPPARAAPAPRAGARGTPRCRCRVMHAEYSACGSRLTPRRSRGQTTERRRRRAPRRRPAARAAGLRLGSGATSSVEIASNSVVFSRFGQLGGSLVRRPRPLETCERASLLDDAERGAQQRLHPPRLGEQPLALALRRARDRTRLLVRLGDDHLGLALRRLHRLGGRALRRDQRRREQRLALLHLVEMASRRPRAGRRARRARARRPRSCRRRPRAATSASARL